MASAAEGPFRPSRSEESQRAFSRPKKQAISRWIPFRHSVSHLKSSFLVCNRGPRHSCDVDHLSRTAQLHRANASGTESTGHGAAQITLCVTPGLPFSLEFSLRPRPITIRSACSFCACRTICSAVRPASTANSGLHHSCACGGNNRSVSFRTKLKSLKRSG
jgi:hypothetical protein